MATRIPISWLILLAIVGIFVFFGYHILQASAANSNTKPQIETYESLRGPTQVLHGSELAPIVSHTRPPTLTIQHVPAQAEEELRASEPLQATPPAVQYEPPEATDPMNTTAYMDAMFGNNFRHPEQMIEVRPASNTTSIVDSGLGSEQSSPGGHTTSTYSPEMAQNGGEFMRGIHAFDLSESGSAYSMI